MSEQPPNELDYEGLAERIGMGDRSAEELLVSELQPGVFAVLVARTRDRELALDLLQETLWETIAALRRRALREPAKLPGFVLGIARNLANKQFRTSQRRPPMVELPADVPAAIIHPALDALGRHGNRLQAGRAEAIDGHRRHLNRQPRAQRRNASHVHPLLGLRHGAAQDDVFNFPGIKLRHAIERALDRNRSQFIRTRSPQRPLKRAPHRSADGRNQNDFTHGPILTAEAAECAEKIRQ